MERTDEATSAEATTEASAVSMHEGVETWHDLCSCRPEQRWQDAVDDS